MFEQPIEFLPKNHPLANGVLKPGPQALHEGAIRDFFVKAGQLVDKAEQGMDQLTKINPREWLKDVLMKERVDGLLQGGLITGLALIVVYLFANHKKGK